MVTPLIVPYARFSRSYKSLLEEGSVVKLDRALSSDSDRYILNWGFGRNEIPRNHSRHFSKTSWYKGSNKVINPVRCVAIAKDKTYTFQMLEEFGIDCVPWTTKKTQASKWFDEDGTLVVCRSTTKGKAGEGIFLAEGKKSLKTVKLYTKYIPKKNEYRVHVFGDRVIDFAQKKRSMNCEEPDWKIRSYNNGWIFARKNVKVPSSAKKLAVLAVHSLGLNFGAVDMLKCSRTGKFKVLEINTAPGLEGTTLKRYKKAIKDLHDVSEEWDCWNNYDKYERLDELEQHFEVIQKFRTGKEFEELLKKKLKNFPTFTG